MGRRPYCWLMLFLYHLPLLPPRRAHGHSMETNQSNVRIRRLVHYSLRGKQALGPDESLDHEILWLIGKTGNVDCLRCARHIHFIQRVLWTSYLLV